MKNSILHKFVFACLLTAGLVSCKKDDPASLIPPPIPDQSFIEEFDTLASAYHRGWIPVNNSKPKGQSIWTQGGSLQPLFAPFSSRGTYAGFVGVDYLSTSADTGVISNWLISPLVVMQNGDRIVFYTRSLVLPAGGGDSTDYGNNLEVCINKNNESANVGTANDPRSGSYNAATDRGDFSMIFTLNPPKLNTARNFHEYRLAHTLASLSDPLAYPSKWTRFEVIVGGLNAPHRGRFAFRYYILDGGANGNGTAIGIDQVSYISKK